MPWEFLQGAAEQKQKGFDTADAGVDTAGKLLQFETIPGDEPWKAEKQKQYNEQLLKVRDQLHTTGNSSEAAKALTNVVRNISQDRDIAIMTAAVEPYKDQFKAWQKMKQEDKFTQPWQEDFNPMYSTRDKKTGKHSSYNQSVGYESPDFYKDVNENFGTLHIDDITKGGYFIDENGMKITAVTGGGKIDKEAIAARARQGMTNYRFSKSYKDHLVQARKYEGLTGEDAIKRADEISLAKLYAHGLDQIRTVYKSTSDITDMGDDYRKRFKTNDSPYIPLEAKNLFTNANDDDFDKQMSTHLEGSYSGSMTGGGGTQTTVYTDKGYKTFDKLKQGNKQIALKYFESTGNEALRKKYVNGTATQAELGAISAGVKNYRNQFFAAAKQNLQGRNMADVGEAARDYIGIDAGSSGEFNASMLKSGAGFLTGGTKIYREDDGSAMQLKDLELADGDKAVINKEYSPASPYYTISGGDAKFATPRQLVITDKSGNVKGIYAIPVTNPNTKEGKINSAVAKNATSLYTPNTFTQSHSANHRIKYVPYNPNTNKPLNNDEIVGMRKAGMNMTAVYNIYDKHGNMVGQAASPEEATTKIEEIKQQ